MERQVRHRHDRPPRPRQRGPVVVSDVGSASLGKPETLLLLAEEVHAADLQVKEAILKAARRGDCKAIIALVERWIDQPAVEVAEGLKQS